MSTTKKKASARGGVRKKKASGATTTRKKKSSARKATGTTTRKKTASRRPAPKKKASRSRASRATECESAPESGAIDESWAGLPGPVEPMEFGRPLEPAVLDPRPASLQTLEGEIEKVWRQVEQACLPLVETRARAAACALVVGVAVGLLF